MACAVHSFCRRSVANLKDRSTAHPFKNKGFRHKLLD